MTDGAACAVICMRPVSGAGEAQFSAGPRSKFPVPFWLGLWNWLNNAEVTDKYFIGQLCIRDQSKWHGCMPPSPRLLPFIRQFGDTNGILEFYVL